MKSNKTEAKGEVISKTKIKTHGKDDLTDDFPQANKFRKRIKIEDDFIK